MQKQTTLQSRLAAIVVLALLLVLGLIAGLQQHPHLGPNRESAQTVSATNPPTEIRAATAQAQVEHYKSEYTKPGVTDTVLAHHPGWNFVVVNSGDKRSVEVGTELSIRSAKMRGELAEAHNLLQMQSYQRRVTRQLKSRTPIMPASFVPTLEETNFEGSRTK